MDIAIAGVAASVALQGDRIVAARVALGAVAPTPILVPGINETLAGKPASDTLLMAAADLAVRAARPVTDMRGTAEYRRHLCRVLTRRTLEDALDHARGRQ
jgi:carbon-monoxide dehydrogenase medium subunit